MTGRAGVELLKVDRSAVVAAATALLDIYGERRAVLGLEELLEGAASSGPGVASCVRATLADVKQLPWIPSTLAAPASPQDWRWGLRAAQRVLQLELDVLREALLGSPDPADAALVFAARKPIDDAMAALEAEHTSFVAPGGAAWQAAQQLRSAATRETGLQNLKAVGAGVGALVDAHLRTATAAFHRALRGLSPPALAATAGLTELFGVTGRRAKLTSRAYKHFLGSALAIEAIRRSFSDDFDIEAGQTLRLAQLTPLVPSPVFVSDPFGETGPSSPEAKLTGIRLGHFAGFYRASWRANDFMWGRLDAAAVIVALLVDAERAALRAELPETAPWEVLARALVPAADGAEPGDEARRQLVLELLPEGGEGELEARLRDALEADLTTGDGSLAKAACIRALQFEALRDEVPVIVQEAKRDRRAGARRTSLGLPEGELGWDELVALRAAAEPLPVRLGRDDPEEATSTLALRVVAHAFLVALAASAGAVPLTRVLQPLRVPLLVVEGITARRLLDRLAVVLAFTGAAWYLGERWLRLPAEPPAVPLSALWSPEVLALWVSILAVLGVVLVPLLRAVRADSWRRRLLQAMAAVLLLAAGGGVAFGWQWQLHGPATALTAAGSGYAPPEWLLWLVVAVGGVQGAASAGSILRLGSLAVGMLGRVESLGKAISTPALVPGVVGAILAAYSAWNGLVPFATHPPMQSAAAALAFLAPPLLWAYVRGWRRGG